MAQSLPTCSMLVDDLREAFNSTFHDHDALVQAGIDPVVWTEGGEWPQFSELFSPVADCGDERDFDESFVNPGVESIASKVVSKLQSDGPAINLTLDCGVGKSTKAVVDLYRYKAARSIIVVQPSIVVAQRLAKYVAWLEDGADVSTDLLPDRTRGIVYISAGKLLKFLLTGGKLEDDLLLLDEAHCVTPVYRCVHAIVKRLKVRTLQLTASHGAGIRGPKGARLHAVKRCEPVVSESLGKAQDRSAMVGVAETGAYAMSANMLIGATVDLRVIYDTGLRPDPIIKQGKICSGERQATSVEIIQMLGRLGRIKGTVGQAFYTQDAPTMQESGRRLYDIVYNVLLAVAGLPSAYSREKAMALYASGFIPSPSNRDSLNSSSANDSLSSAVSASGDVGVIEEVLSDVPCETDYAGLKPRRKHRRKRSSKSSSDLEESLRVDKPKKDSFYTSYSRPKLTYRRSTFASDDDDSIDNRLQRNLSNGLGDLTLVNDHPYKRGIVNYPGVHPTRSLITSCMQALDKLWSSGGRVYAGTFDVDPADVGRSDKEDARRVLAHQMLASYTEDEVHAVMLLWNQVAATAPKGVVPAAVFVQFRDYFSSYGRYVDAYGITNSSV